MNPPPGIFGALSLIATRIAKAAVSVASGVGILRALEPEKGRFREWLNPTVLSLTKDKRAQAHVARQTACWTICAMLSKEVTRQIAALRESLRTE